jgi:peroxiredoxin Q/BCP
MRIVVRTTLPALLLVSLSLAATAAKAADDEKKVDLQVGDVAPVFEATDDQGMVWKSASHVGQKYIVLYFYPGDFTPGCMKQAESFRDNMNKLSDAGAEVIGVSGDSAATHALFKESQKLNFALLADEKGTLAKRFGVPVGDGGVVKTKDANGMALTIKREATLARWTFIIGMDGKILYKNTKVNPVEDSKEVAAFIKKLAKD